MTIFINVLLLLKSALSAVVVLINTHRHVALQLLNDAALWPLGVNTNNLYSLSQHNPPWPVGAL